VGDFSLIFSKTSDPSSFSQIMGLPGEGFQKKISTGEKDSFFS